MQRNGGRALTAAENVELWRRYKAGESMNGIARLLGRGVGAVFGVLQRTGGIRPAQRRRSPRVLSLVEREEVSRGIAGGESIRAIARGLSRAPSTVSPRTAHRRNRRLTSGTAASRGRRRTD